MPEGKVFMPVRTRTVKEDCFDMDAVSFNQIGDVLIVTPKDQAGKVFFLYLNEFTDNFLTDGRCQPPLQERMPF